MAFASEAIFLPHEMKATHWNTFLGAGLILACVVLSTLLKMFKERQTDPDSCQASLRKEEVIPKEQKC